MKKKTKLDSAAGALGALLLAGAAGAADAGALPLWWLVAQSALGVAGLAACRILPLVRAYRRRRAKIVPLTAHAAEPLRIGM